MSFHHLLAELLRWRPGAYAHGSVKLLIWMLVRAVLQVATVVILSHLLGAEGYGQFVSTVAVASLLIPLAGLGLSGILLRNGARKPSRINAFLRQAIKVWVVSTLICSIVAISLAWFLLPYGPPWHILPFVITAEVASVSLTDLVARSEQARHRIGCFGAINSGLPLIRLIMLGGCVLGGPMSVEHWLLVYAGSGGLYVIFMLWWVRFPNILRKGGRGLEIRHGLPFAAAALSLRLQGEFNKPILARLDFGLAGNFSAAQRMVDISSLPLVAMQEALWPRLYNAGGAVSKHRAAIALLLLMSMGIGGLLWVIAPWLPHFLGRDFSSAVGVLRWLAFLPALQCCRNLINCRAVTENRLNLAGCSFVAAAIVGVAVNIASIPYFGVEGAVLACYISEGVIVAIQWTGLRLTRISKYD